MENTYKQLYEMQKLNWVSMVETAIEVAGSGAELARLMGVSESAIYQWKNAAGLPSSKSREFIVKYLDDNGRTWTYVNPAEERSEIVKVVAEGMDSMNKTIAAGVDLQQTRLSTLYWVLSLNLVLTISGFTIVLHKMGAM